MFTGKYTGRAQPSCPKTIYCVGWGPCSSPHFGGAGAKIRRSSYHLVVGLHCHLASRPRRYQLPLLRRRRLNRRSSSTSHPKVRSSNQGSDIRLSGTVNGLNGRELWIISRADSADQLYYLTLQSPVTTADGPWNVTDESVGDDSDRGHNRLYLAIAADGDCADSLAAVQPDADGVLSFPRLHRSCLQLGAPRAVSFPQL